MRAAERMHACMHALCSLHACMHAALSVPCASPPAAKVNSHACTHPLPLQKSGRPFQGTYYLRLRDEAAEYLRELQAARAKGDDCGIVVQVRHVVMQQQNHHMRLAADRMQSTCLPSSREP